MRQEPVVRFPAAPWELSGYAWAKPTRDTFVCRRRGRRGRRTRRVTAERLQNFGRFHQSVVGCGWDLASNQTVSARVIGRPRPDLDWFLVWDRSRGQPVKVLMTL